MKIFPAIDIKDKKCVRLIKGDFENKTEYETSPIEQAAKFKDHGFKNLHIVDLDGALTGQTINLDTIKEKTIPELIKLDKELDDKYFVISNNTSIEIDSVDKEEKELNIEGTILKEKIEFLQNKIDFYFSKNITEFQKECLIKVNELLKNKDINQIDIDLIIYIC